ncbi:ribulose-phosphate 3-epimerase [Tetragenococcus osmophilus]|uniref:Ribulose-phosphate 3-epimerase n=2 Tax=Tetragenococcus osmophilus TaxID=526944 RepID=A0AA37XLF5_9ENTE|nr:ribulose-phosphate 3-epimerase [Tetragenococcus osmophilus]GMA54081.1 ribulose-phosphate 3-epimerase [Alicyclobacillus contaminans]GMA72029.1 ribulose-phosphate 3-epimerase [Tetragenococcus osmophilus]
MKKMAASLMCADVLHLEKELKYLEEAGCDLLHLDVMDGIFVNNMAMYPEMLEKIKFHTSIPFDIHLATITPEKYVDMFTFLQPKYLTFHVETVKDPIALIKKIKEQGIRPSIAINPETPVEAILPYIEQVDMILVMTVHTGFAGQSFLEETLGKIKELYSILSSLKNPPLVEVDGNIYSDTIQLMEKSMPDVFVLGTSGLFYDKNDSSYKQRIEELRQIIQTY